MQDVTVKFQGSPQKYGKAGYCDIFYTESKLYDNILYKDFIHFKQVWGYKSQVISLQALKDHLQTKHFYSDLQKNQLISCQLQQIKFLKQKNRQLCQKNIKRTQKIILNHNTQIQQILKQKEEQIKVIQSQKEILQNRIQQLQTELNKYLFIVNNIDNEREQTTRRNKQRERQLDRYQNLLKQKQQEWQKTEKQYKDLVHKLQEQKLQIQLHFKKKMIEHTQTNNHEISEIQRFYQKKLQQFQEERLIQSVSSKQNLNKILKKHQVEHKELRQRLYQQQGQIDSLRKQLGLQTQKNKSLLDDIKKQDDILDKYQNYLKDADENILKLKEILQESQTQLERVKVTLQKNNLEKQSMLNRFKICQEQARMWRQSYYLKQSREYVQN